MYRCACGHLYTFQPTGNPHIIQGSLQQALQPLDFLWLPCELSSLPEAGARGPLLGWSAMQLVDMAITWFYETL